MTPDLSLVFTTNIHNGVNIRSVRRSSVRSETLLGSVDPEQPAGVAGIDAPQVLGG